MALFSGEYKETFVLDVPLEVAKKHFANLDTIAENYGPIESWDKVDEERLHIVLKKQSVRGESFKPDYVCRYHFSQPNTLVWETVEGNMVSKGQADFSEASTGGTQVIYHGQIETELSLGRILGKIISPIAGALMKNGIRDYVKRMKAAAISS